MGNKWQLRTAAFAHNTVLVLFGFSMYLEAKAVFVFLFFYVVPVFLVRPPHKTAMLFVCSFPPTTLQPGAFSPSIIGGGARLNTCVSVVCVWERGTRTVVVPLFFP